MSLARYAAKLAALLGSDGKVPAAGLATGAAVSNLGFNPMVGDGTYNGNPSIDLNTVVTSGSYRLGAGATNLPASGTGYGNLLVMRAPAHDTIVQIYVTYDQSAMFVRSGNPSNVGGGGSWTAWKRMVNTDDFVWSPYGQGYQKLPNGFIIQWGSYTVGNGSGATRSFNFAFPNSCYAVFNTHAGGQSGTYDDGYSALASVTASTYRFVYDTTRFWMAIGN